MVCSKCKEDKDVLEFYKNNRTKTGYAYTCKVCLREYQKIVNKKSITPKINKERYIKCMYGITMDDYNKLRQEQDYKCAICKTHEDKLPRVLSIDHCHISGKVRGLLCDHCNHGLGKFKDNTLLLLEAIEYLNK